MKKSLLFAGESNLHEYNSDWFFELGSERRVLWWIENPLMKKNSDGSENTDIFKEFNDYYRWWVENNKGKESGDFVSQIESDFDLLDIDLTTDSIKYLIPVTIPRNSAQYKRLEWIKEIISDLAIKWHILTWENKDEIKSHFMEYVRAKEKSFTSSRKSHEKAWKDLAKLRWDFELNKWFLKWANSLTEMVENMENPEYFMMAVAAVWVFVPKLRAWLLGAFVWDKVLEGLWFWWIFKAISQDRESIEGLANGLAEKYRLLWPNWNEFPPPQAIQWLSLIMPKKISEVKGNIPPGTLEGLRIEALKAVKGESSEIDNTENPLIAWNKYGIQNSQMYLWLYAFIRWSLWNGNAEKGWEIFIADENKNKTVQDLAEEYVFAELDAIDTAMNWMSWLGLSTQWLDIEAVEMYHFGLDYDVVVGANKKKYIISLKDEHKDRDWNPKVYLFERWLALDDAQVAESEINSDGNILHARSLSKEKMQNAPYKRFVNNVIGKWKDIPENKWGYSSPWKFFEDLHRKAFYIIGREPDNIMSLLDAVIEWKEQDPNKSIRDILKSLYSRTDGTINAISLSGVEKSDFNFFAEYPKLPEKYSAWYVLVKGENDTFYIIPNPTWNVVYEIDKKLKRNNIVLSKALFLNPKVKSIIDRLKERKETPELGTLLSSWEKEIIKLPKDKQSYNPDELHKFAKDIVAMKNDKIKIGDKSFSKKAVAMQIALEVIKNTWKWKSVTEIVNEMTGNTWLFAWLGEFFSWDNSIADIEDLSEDINDLGGLGLIDLFFKGLESVTDLVTDYLAEEMRQITGTKLFGFSKRFHVLTGDNDKKYVISLNGSQTVNAEPAVYVFEKGKVSDKPLKEDKITDTELLQARKMAKLSMELPLFNDLLIKVWELTNIKDISSFYNLKGLYDTLQYYLFLSLGIETREKKLIEFINEWNASNFADIYSLESYFQTLNQMWNQEWIDNKNSVPDWVDYKYFSKYPHLSEKRFPGFMLVKWESKNDENLLFVIEKDTKTVYEIDLNKFTNGNYVVAWLLDWSGAILPDNVQKAKDRITDDSGVYEATMKIEWDIEKFIPRNKQKYNPNDLHELAKKLSALTGTVKDHGERKALADLIILGVLKGFESWYKNNELLLDPAFVDPTKTYIVNQIKSLGLSGDFANNIKTLNNKIYDILGVDKTEYLPKTWNFNREFFTKHPSFTEKRFRNYFLAKPLKWDLVFIIQKEDPYKVFSFNSKKEDAPSPIANEDDLSDDIKTVRQRMIDNISIYEDLWFLESEILRKIKDPKKQEYNPDDLIKFINITEKSKKLSRKVLSLLLLSYEKGFDFKKSVDAMGIKSREISSRIKTIPFQRSSIGKDIIILNNNIEILGLFEKYKDTEINEMKNVPLLSFGDNYDVLVEGGTRYVISLNPEDLVNGQPAVYVFDGDVISSEPLEESNITDWPLSRARWISKFKMENPAFKSLMSKKEISDFLASISSFDNLWRVYYWLNKLSENSLWIESREVDLLSMFWSSKWITTSAELDTKAAWLHAKWKKEWLNKVILGLPDKIQYAYFWVYPNLSEKRFDDHMLVKWKETSNKYLYIISKDTGNKVFRVNLDKLSESTDKAVEITDADISWLWNVNEARIRMKESDEIYNMTMVFENYITGDIPIDKQKFDPKDLHELAKKVLKYKNTVYWWSGTNFARDIVLKMIQGFNSWYIIDGIGGFNKEVLSKIKKLDLSKSDFARALKKLNEQFDNMDISWEASIDKEFFNKHPSFKEKRFNNYLLAKWGSWELFIIQRKSPNNVFSLDFAGKLVPIDKNAVSDDIQKIRIRMITNESIYTELQRAESWIKSVIEGRWDYNPDHLISLVTKIDSFANKKQVISKIILLLLIGAYKTEAKPWEAQDQVRERIKKNFYDSVAWYSQYPVFDSSGAPDLSVDFNAEIKNKIASIWFTWNSIGEDIKILDDSIERII